MPTVDLRSPAWAATIVVLALCHAGTVLGVKLCTCMGCVGLSGPCVLMSGADTALPGDEDAADGDTTPSAEFRIGARWTSTSSSRFDGSRGGPMNLTWSIVDDGTTIAGFEGTSGSDLVAMLNRRYGSGPTIATSPWFRLFEDSFNRWGELSGLTFAYEPNDGGARIDNTSSPRGQPGVYADLRVGGHSIDGASGSNILAYNYFPPHGDMVLDTDNESFYGDRRGDSLRLRNVLMHEIGHGLGFNHLESSNASFLMEPFISVGFDGPQFDDILAAHRNYGDALEKNGGNDDHASATPIGVLSAGGAWSIGNDAGGARVQPNQTDFVSIDGTSDEDWFRFSTPTLARASLSLLPRGPSYREGPQDGDQTTLNTRSLADLELGLFLEDPFGRNIAEVAESNVTGLGGAESVSQILILPGREYLVRVSSLTDQVQMYNLLLSLSPFVIPEPGAGFLLGLLGTIALRGRSR
ncbi:MAG: matrixin family metalloprotease [Planctomycetota bacterium]